VWNKITCGDDQKSERVISIQEMTSKCNAKPGEKQDEYRARESCKTAPTLAFNVWHQRTQKLLEYDLVCECEGRQGVTSGTHLEKAMSDCAPGTGFE